MADSGQEVPGKAEEMLAVQVPDVQAGGQDLETTKIPVWCEHL